MAPVRSDYIERMIEKLGQFVAAIVKLLREERWVEAEQKIDEASVAALGMELGPLLLMDAPTTAAMLGDPERTRTLARLVELKVTVLEGRERMNEALELRAHARALREAADLQS